MKAQLLTGALGLALLLPTTPATAQTPPSAASTEQQQKAQKELERKALVLLDDIIKDSQAYKVAENRLRLKAIAANLLWKYDEARARVLFKEAMAGVADLLSNQDEVESSETRMFRGVTNLRRELLNLLVLRDARMARDFLRATRSTAPRKGGGRSADDDSDLHLESSLATHIAESDPQQALEIAQEILAKGISAELISTLNRLRAKDHESAAKLANALVAKLRSEDLTTNQAAASVAATLFEMVFNTESESADKDTKKTAPLLDEQGRRDLMELNLDLALSAPNNSGPLRMLAAVMPQVHKYAPARAAELRRRMAQFKGAENAESGLDGRPEDWDKYQELMLKGTADELVAAAAKAPSYMRDNLYQLAASKFADKGEYERARDILTEHVSDSPYRKQLLAELERQASLAIAAQGQIEQFRKQLANLKTVEERATTLAQVALALTAKGERKVARRLLEEAAQLVSYRAKNIKQLSAQLFVVQAYAKLEPERSLTMLEPIVDQLNDLVAAAATLGSFLIGDEIMQDDELRMEIYTEFFFNLSGAFIPDLRSLAGFDFERTRALADRFQRDEVRMMARLLVVQSVLGDQPTGGSAFGRTVFTSTGPGEPEVKTEETGTP